VYTTGLHFSTISFGVEVGHPWLKWQNVAGGLRARRLQASRRVGNGEGGIFSVSHPLRWLKIYAYDENNFITVDALD